MNLKTKEHKNIRMVNYQTGKIYKLWSPSKNLVYIGSTTQTLPQRLTKHLSGYKRYTNDNTKKYYTSFLILDCGDYKIELIEEYVCNNRQQLEKKEGEHIRNNECVNKYIAGRTDAEYYKDNTEKIKEYQQQYIKEHRNKIKEGRKQYYKDNIDKFKQYYLNTKLEQKI